MPSVVSVQPRDIYVLVEFSIDEIQKILTVMDLIELNYDGTDKEQAEAKKYFVDKFYPFFKELKKELIDAPDSQRS